MPVNILMPALSPTMEKGNLAKWLKKEGDSIKSGDVIAEIETDKATMEVEAVDEGVLAKITVPEGTNDVPVNQIIGLIAGEGEDPKSVAASGGGASAPAAAPAPSALSGQAGGGGEPAGQMSYARANQAPEGPAQPQAGQAQPAAKPNGAGAAGGRVFASPLARRVAKEAGIDLAGVQGSGPHGRIVQSDVKTAITGGGAQARGPQPGTPAPVQAPAGAPAPAMSDQQIKKFFEPGSYEEIPHDNMRKTIARRLAASMQTTPHFYLTVDCDLDALLAMREQINAGAPKDKDGKPAFKLSVNDFMIKAHALALIRVPAANVSWTEGSLLKHKHVDIGVAVAIPEGLITPIIRKADVQSLSAISNAMKDFGARAKTRKLKPSEYEGGSTALSNLGMFGIKQFTAIINPPHSTILAVGAGEKRVAVRNGAPAVATVMSATLSCDHRAIDGALGAEVIAAFRQLVENPMTMLVCETFACHPQSCVIMLNLHAPFRRAASGDETRIAKLAGGEEAASIEDTVVADETGRITAVLSGAPEGETWRITTLEIAPERLAELAPRILAVADALAADEGLVSVTLEAGGFAQDMLAIVDQEGFRPAADGAGQGGSRSLVRPVVPQG